MTFPVCGADGRSRPPPLFDDDSIKCNYELFERKNRDYISIGCVLMIQNTNIEWEASLYWCNDNGREIWIQFD